MILRQTLLIRLLLGFLLLGQAACSTFLEMSSPTDSSLGYEKQTNAQGETVYRRETVSPETLTPLAPAPLVPTPLLPPTSLQPPQSGLAPSGAAPSEPSTGSRPQVSSSDEKSDSGWFISPEIAAAKGYGQLGIDIGKEVFPVLDLRGGVAFFFGNQTYMGFDLGARAKIKIAFVEPFVGVGGYGGDLKSCSKVGVIETCEKKFLYAAFTEYGVAVFNFALFFRNYSIEEAGRNVPSVYSVGLNYIYRF